MRCGLVVLVLVCGTVPGSRAIAQTSSLGKKAKQAQWQTPPGPNTSSAREGKQAYQGNTLLEQSSLIAIEVKPPKEFKPNDIITVIVRQQKRFEADSELENKRDFEIKSELDAFIKHEGGGIGAAVFRRGKPNIDYDFGARLKGEGDTKREDTFVTRISGKIVDVKPNGNLVIAAKSEIGHDEEVAVVTLTGECRSADVTPDNTVLSTQLAELVVDVENSGAIKDAATRGWLTRLLDLLKPI
jgi:flagellar L-ring protein precursor FlgH